VPALADRRGPSIYATPVTGRAAGRAAGNACVDVAHP
jgi:hypothetical protein